MKLMLVFLFMTIFTVQAKIFSQKYSVSANNVQLRDVLRSIEDQGDYRFFFSDDVADLNQNIKINVNGATIEQLLSGILPPRGLSYEILDNNLIVISPYASVSEKTQDITISGAITDTNGESMPGVNIIIKGSLTGVTSDVNGKYNIRVPDKNAALIFSFIGFISQEIAVGNQQVINVIMAEETRSLDEVVVVGYGSQRKSDLTGSIASVKGDDLMQLPTMRTDQALQGRATGVSVQQTDGAPGGNVMIRIRGGNSISGGNNALIVVDGMQSGDISVLNPNDIESVEVLKDASATAIYGARGANGVILITTKRGARGKPVFDYNYSIGSQNLSKKIDLMGAADYARKANVYAATQTGTFGKPVTPSIPFTDADISAIERGSGTDWQDEIYRPGLLQSHLISMSGGSDNIRYFVSGGYLDQEGIVINTDYERYNLRTNLDLKMTSWLDAGVSMNFIKSTGNIPPVGEGTRYVDITGQVINSILRFDPITPVYDEFGEYHTRPVSAPTTGINYADVYIWNPVATAYETKIEKNNVIQDVNGFFDINIIKGLTFRITGSASISNSDEMRYYGMKTMPGAAVNGSGSVESSQSQFFQNSNILTYNNTFGDHKITLTGVGEQQLSKYKMISSISAQGFSSDITNIHDLSSAAQINSRSNDFTKRALNSWLGRVNYAFKDRYILTASIRADGSSVFGDDNKWGYFPSASVAWRAAEESFLKDIDWLSNLKLRGSYGQTGNQAISPYQSLPILNSGRDYPYFGGDTRDVGYMISTSANPGLKWEATTQTDIGLDLGFFNQRLTFAVDLYKKTTKDLLMSKDVPRYTGFTSALYNVGSIENKGFELSVEATPVTTRDILWTSEFNLSSNKNKILKLASDVPLNVRTNPGGGYQFFSNSWSLKRLVVGEPVEQIYGYKYLGTWSTSEAEEAAKYGQLPGESKWFDANDDGKIDITNDGYQVIGNASPKFYYGWNNSINYKNFNLSFLIQGSSGNDIFNAVRIKTEDPNLGLSPKLFDRWTETNQNTNIPAFSDQYGREEFNQIHPSTVSMGVDTRSSRWVEDGSYIRLKNLTFTYNLPSSLLNKIYINRLSVYVSGTNLLTVTKYSGYDPEVSSFNVATGGMGIDLSNYPTSRIFTLGINVTF
ncbi:MAG: TonB-dependent receptor [Dysgonamonadaceae bacterium]|nr:TonB-dependent receptor [Dysgonamonadaceae bacterium]